MSRKHFLYDGQEPGMLYGIAAMPSLHVAMVAMIMFFLFSLHPAIGVFGAVYLLMMFIGSVFLQWHYALDGYVGFILGAAVWLTARKIDP